ncbi:hypothetical protein MIMGU_mgv1a020617mg, partial [Erythranthe guttata]
AYVAPKSCSISGEAVIPAADDKPKYPPGYRFVPKDVELIVDYLEVKIKNLPIPLNEINEVHLYEHHPQFLADNNPQLGEKEWYFFTPRDRKYQNGQRPSRSAGNGYWKATGSDKVISSGGKIVGYKKSLVYHEGKAPAGIKTNWIMHEYKVNQPGRAKTCPTDMRLDDWVLCRLYIKSERANNKRKRGDETAQLVKEEDEEINENQENQEGEEAAETNFGNEDQEAAETNSGNYNEHATIGSNEYANNICYNECPNNICYNEFAETINNTDTLLFDLVSPFCTNIKDHLVDTPPQVYNLPPSSTFPDYRNDSPVLSDNYNRPPHYIQPPAINYTALPHNQNHHTTTDHNYDYITAQREMFGVSPSRQVYFENHRSVHMPYNIDCPRYQFMETPGTFQNSHGNIPSPHIQNQGNIPSPHIQNQGNIPSPHIQNQGIYERAPSSFGSSSLPSTSTTGASDPTVKPQDNCNDHPDYNQSMPRKRHQQ